MIDTSEIKRNVSPVEVIERYTGMKRSHGKFYCPFHSDRTPSLSVKADIWKCWGCGAHGDVISFVQKYFGLSFRDASRKLAEDFSLNIRIDEPKKQDIWCEIEAEIRKERKEELQEIRAEIDREIEELTVVHRVLFQYGAPQRLCDQYIEEIESLEEFKDIWR